MVCLPCFIIPLLLYIWHKFCQPILLRYWNPWQKKDAEGNIIKAGPDFPFQCKGDVCPFVPGTKKQNTAIETNTNEDGTATAIAGAEVTPSAAPAVATVTANDNVTKKKN